MRPGVSWGDQVCPRVSWGNQTDPQERRRAIREGTWVCSLMLNTSVN